MFLSCRENNTKISHSLAPWQQVNGRIVIDAHAFYRSNNIVKPKLRPLDSPTERKEDSEASRSPRPSGKPRRNNSRESYRSSSSSSEAESVEAIDVMALNTAKPGNSERTEDLRPMSDEQCLLATPWVLGMDMKTKQWGAYQ